MNPLRRGAWKTLVMVFLGFRPMTPMVMSNFRPLAFAKEKNDTKP